MMPSARKRPARFLRTMARHRGTTSFSHMDVMVLDIRLVKKGRAASPLSQVK